MNAPPEPPPRSYGCSYGCGNPYDYVIVSVADSTTELLCLPCFVRLASELVAAVTDPSDGKVQTALAEAGYLDTAPVAGPTAKRRGRNAPANADDPDLITAYEDVVLEDDLPAEFR